MLNDETNTLADGLETATEQAAPETEIKTADQDFESANDDAEQSGSPEGETEGTEGKEPEFVTVEYDGEQFEVPPKLKEAFLRQQDYTRKTQEVANERKAIEAERQEVAQMFQVSQEELGARAAAVNLDNQLQQYADIDWQQLLRDDPIGAQEHRWNYDALLQQRQQVAQYLQNAEYTRTETAQRETAKRIQETRDFAEKNIAGWNDQLDSEITKFAVEDLGFSRDMLLQAYNPQIYRTLHLARVGALSLQKQQAAKPASQPAIKPLTRVSAKTSAQVTKDPSEMSMDEYAAWRQKSR